MGRTPVLIILCAVVTFSHQFIIEHPNDDHKNNEVSEPTSNGTREEKIINYRLPKIAEPIHYELELNPHMHDKEFSFDGKVDISLIIPKPTRNLTLHSTDLSIHEEKTFLRDRVKFFKIIKHEYQSETEFLILHFMRDIDPGYYQLHFEYSSLKTNNASQGFYRGNYSDENNKTTWYVATEFQVTYARSAFPCWDEPAFKATFGITIHHFPNYTALSNMPVEVISAPDEIDGKIRTKFETTPLMSTYIVAFAVSDFVNVTNPEGNFSIWVKKSDVENVNLGYSSSLRAFRLLEEYTNMPYELKKMDSILIPLKNVGTIENWGLIVYKSAIILNDSNTSMKSQLFGIDISMHEITHQWFGNLVSPNWWSDLWITEGITTYLGHILTSEIVGSGMMDYAVDHIIFKSFWIIDKQMEHDPLVSRADNPSALNYHLHKIHRKGAAVMRMLSNLLSAEVFQTGLQMILQKYKFGTITTEQFWITMQEALMESRKPEDVIDLEEKFGPYVTQIGYPVIYVTRNYTTGTIEVTQQCNSQKKKDGCRSKWWIPINFATSSSPDFSNTDVTFWMSPKEEKLIIEGVPLDDWVIFNKQVTGYYRVIYDEENLRKISRYLNSDEYSKIHIRNRAAILNDAFWSFSEKILHKDLLIKLVSYLSREMDYVPWVSGTEILGTLMKDCGNNCEDMKTLTTNILISVLRAIGSEEIVDPGRLFFRKMLIQLFPTRV